MISPLQYILCPCPEGSDFGGLVFGMEILLVIDCFDRAAVVRVPRAPRISGEYKLCSSFASSTTPMRNVHGSWPSSVGAYSAQVAIFARCEVDYGASRTATWPLSPKVRTVVACRGASFAGSCERGEASDRNLIY
jgi:hypothetical protein